MTCLMLCSLLSEAQPVLERAALHHAAAHAKAACIEALSIIAFVGVESPIETHDILATLSKLFSSGRDHPICRSSIKMTF